MAIDDMYGGSSTAIVPITTGNAFDDLITRHGSEDASSDSSLITKDEDNSFASSGTLSVEEERKQYIARGISGLDNMGNTCYMNATLQCLSAVSLFNYWLQKERYKKAVKATVYATKLNELKKKSISITREEFDKECNNACQSSVTHQLAKVFIRMWKENCIVRPKRFKSVVGSLNEEFSGYGQNDSQEILSFILDRVHEETKRKVPVTFHDMKESVQELCAFRKECAMIVQDKTRPLEERQATKQRYKEYCRQHPEDTTILNAYSAWKKHIQNSYSIVSNLFTGMYYSSITCNECGGHSASFEPFTTISLPTPDYGETTLDECLRIFSEEDELTGINQYRCKFCEKKVDAKKKMYIWEPPETLIIQLKRFKHAQISTKTHSRIDFPIEGLELNNNFSPIHARPDSVYDLVAVTEHRGTCNSGHYVAYRKNEINGLWYEFNDEDPTYIPIDELKREIVTPNAYVLFYVRRKLTFNPITSETVDATEDAAETSSSSSLPELECIRPATYAEIA